MLLSHTYKSRYLEDGRPTPVLDLAGPAEGGVGGAAPGEVTHSTLGLRVIKQKKRKFRV